MFVDKLLGIMAACGIGIAARPKAYTWQQLLGATAIAGIGFTMSLFIAIHAYRFQHPRPRRGGTPLQIMRAMRRPDLHRRILC
ncbi:Na+/H+ antiporter NhaA [Rhizobium leguminosarum]|uniref:Na+/H+ antiporter NhaA n=1 Tax=Rhizobium leguminosarum TaxID=384 RepID=UPI0034A3ED63